MYIAASYLKVSKGQVTFNSEGNNNKKSRFYSRKPHVPGSWSGVTIGRGYDMGQKSKQQVIKDLTKAGVSKELAQKLAAGAKLKGRSAKEFLKVSFWCFEITELFFSVTCRREGPLSLLWTSFNKNPIDDRAFSIDFKSSYYYYYYYLYKKAILMTLGSWT